jgi:hypothetical protein
VGAIHHTVGRHCGAVTGRKIEWGGDVIDDTYTNDIMQRFKSMFVSVLFLLCQRSLTIYER